MFVATVAAFVVLLVAAVALPFFFRTPKDFRAAGVLLSLAGIELSVAMHLGVGSNLLGVALLSVGIGFARRAWGEYSEQAIIARGEAAIARAEAQR